MSGHGLEIIADLSPEERSELIRQSAAEIGMNESSVEKDFWVCWVLQRVFSDEALRSRFYLRAVQVYPNVMIS